MTRREKIILIIMFITIIWGCYMLFFNTGKRSLPKASEVDFNSKDEALVKDLSSKLTQMSPSEIETHMLKLADSPWTKDPFLTPAKGLQPKKPQPPVKPNRKSSPKVANWVYSGYLEVGEKRLAIINGIEYEEGENLFPAGYYLAEIKKNYVVIGAIGKQSTYTIPLIEP